ncbi:hypothetical protein [Caulobacter sp. BE254]|uniref:hypothetical protein n=1 Tax=Caulobacter sp. BE254 TaxID=2817720 RepID=UPI0028652D64|nr:hypothetical protein [Caulobacter sp. BE254]MDR7116668.1 hypothetical protein [Caulobacter sp. BE254]
MTFVLRMPKARGPRTRRKALAARVFELGVMALVVFAVGLMVMFTVRYELKVEPKAPAAGARLVHARSMARVRWASVKPRLVARLAQPHALELGKVWARRDGRVCGLVNGWGSFGGLTGMTRFYAQGDEPVFKQDGRPDFEEEWWACKRDRYVVIREGSEETGFCPTKLGRQRCFDVVYGR